MAKKTETKTDTEEQKFVIEDAFTRLEEIISVLENPETGLADAMALYTEGVKLLEQSRVMLDGVEKELKILNPEEA